MSDGERIEMETIRGNKLIARLLKSRLALCICMLAPLVLLAFPIADIASLSYSIFPAPDIANRVAAMTDRMFGGRSAIDEFSHDSGKLDISYTLNEGTSSPMVFVTISLGSAEKPLDGSAFDSVALNIEDATVKRIMIFVKTFVPGVSLPESKNAHTLRHNQYILQLEAGKHGYDIPLHSFLTPQWWTDIMNVNPSLLPKERFDRIVTFDIQLNSEGSDYRLGKREHLAIRSITFKRPPSVASFAIIGLMCAWYVAIFVFLAFRRLANHAPAIPERKALDIPSYREQAMARIRAFLETHYCDPDISTEIVYRELGIPSGKVFELVKREYNLTFKQLVNKMRMEEAKRLLAETDLRVTEIAFGLGFNNITYFNNLFRMHEGMTPSEFREGK
jgi:AraC-like DNA-binding protein